MKKVNFKDDLTVLKENKFYRLSDLYYRLGLRWESDRKVILENTEYKHTILRKYLEQKKHEEDIITFKKIVTEHIKFSNCKLPTEKELVIHLRCGDIYGVTGKQLGVDCSRRVNRQQELLDKILFNKKNGAIHSPRINKVTVVTALHFGSNETTPSWFSGKQAWFYSDEAYEKSIDFLKATEARINECGYAMNLVSNEDVDLDICYMASSQYFIKSISSFSKIIVRCLSEDAREWSKKYRLK